MINTLMAQSPPSAPLATALILALALACTTTAHAQRSLCEPTALAPLASTISARDLGLPALRERGDRCVRVTVRPVELGPPLVARLDGSRCGGRSAPRALRALTLALGARARTMGSSRRSFDGVSDITEDDGVALLRSGMRCLSDP